MKSRGQAGSRVPEAPHRQSAFRQRPARDVRPPGTTRSASSCFTRPETRARKGGNSVALHARLTSFDGRSQNWSGQLAFWHHTQTACLRGQAKTSRTLWHHTLALQVVTHAAKPEQLPGKRSPKNSVALHTRLTSCDERSQTGTNCKLFGTTREPLVHAA